jgi:hypothetical protein
VKWFGKTEKTLGQYSGPSKEWIAGSEFAICTAVAGRQLFRNRWLNAYNEPNFDQETTEKLSGVFTLLALILGFVALQNMNQEIIKYDCLQGYKQTSRNYVRALNCRADDFDRIYQEILCVLTGTAERKELRWATEWLAVGGVDEHNPLYCVFLLNMVFELYSPIIQGAMAHWLLA